VSDGGGFRCETFKNDGKVVRGRMGDEENGRGGEMELGRMGEVKY